MILDPLISARIGQVWGGGGGECQGSPSDVRGHTHILISDGVGRLAHQLLDVLYAAHLGVYLLEDLCALLQAEDDVLLYLRELDVGRQLLELLQLAVSLGEQRLLVLLAAQGEQGALLVALGQHLLGDLGLAVGEDGYAPLVLVQLVALGFEVEDGPFRRGEHAD